MARRTGFPEAAALAAALLALAAASGTASGREFDVKPLTATDGRARCRAPTISETGLAAWVQYTGMEGETEAVRGDLWVCPPGGEPQNLTEDAARFSGRIEQPAACGDGVCFVAWFGDGAEEGPEFSLAAPDLTDEMKALEEEYPSLFNGSIAMMAPEKPEGEGDAGGEGAAEPKEGEGEGEEGQMRRNPAEQSGGSVAYWRDGRFERLTPGGFAFYAPVAGEDTAAFLCARRWPYGYDLVGWTRESGLVQLTTNYFYVQRPRIHGRQVVWQEWDGNDYEIFMHDFGSGETQQLTQNTFDDIEPEIWGGQVVWVAFPLTTGEIFLWREGEIRKISEGTTDNAAPSIWEGRVVWQGVGEDGKQSEIYYYDGRRTIKLTSNVWDDREPVVRDHVVAWISHVDLGDSEIMALDLRDNIPVQLTNDGEEDSCVGVGGDRVLWQTDVGSTSYLRMAVAKPLEMPDSGD